MAGILGDINNNLLGLQRLAAGRQELEQQKQTATDNQEASQLLSRFHSSYQSGQPDYESLNQAIIKSPELAKNVLAGIGIQDKRQGVDAANFVVQAASTLENPEEFMSIAQNRVKYLQNTGRDPSDTLKLIEHYRTGNISEVKNALQSVGAATANQGYLDKDIYAQTFGVGTNAGGQEFNALIKDLSPEEQAKAKRIKIGLDPRAVGSADITTALYGYTDPVARSKADIAGAVEGSKTSADIGARVAGGGRAEEIESNRTATGKEAATRRETFKSQALAAAENVPTLRRAIELQDAINTGGGVNALRKVANYLGVAGQDEGELNSLFGQNILGQLKSTFGGNPTEGEREALAQAQASFNQTGKINSKLLRNALKLAEAKIARGKRAAQADKDAVTVNEIDAALNVSLGDEDTQKRTPSEPSLDELLSKY